MLCSKNCFPFGKDRKLPSRYRLKLIFHPIKRKFAKATKGFKIYGLRKLLLLQILSFSFFDLIGRYGLQFKTSGC